MNNYKWINIFIQWIEMINNEYKWLSNELKLLIIFIQWIIIYVFFNNPSKNNII